MTSILPKDNAFTEEATHLGGINSGYARLVAWTSDSATGDSNVCAAGNLHNGYFSSGTFIEVGSTGRFAAAQHASAGVADPLAFVWKNYFAVRARVKLGFRWKFISAGGVVEDFRRVGVGARLAGHSAYTNTAGSESVTGGNGYWLIVRNVASQPGFKFQLVRVNAGALTLLAQTTAVNASSFNLASGMWISLLVSNSGGNVILRCRRGTSGREAVGGTTEIDIFGADITDSSGSKITAAGRTGFFTTRPPAGSATLIDWFEVQDPSISTVVLRDEWLRSNYVTGATTSTDANNRFGRSLLPSFSGDVGGSQSTFRIGRDPSNNRVTNVGTAAQILGVSAYQATHEAVQKRSLKATWTTPSGRTDTLQIEIRGTGLTSPTTAARCYRLEIECVGTGPAWTLRIVHIDAGAATVLATKSVSLTVATHTFDISADNLGGVTVFDGSPNIKVHVDTALITGWTLAGVSGVALLADGTLSDTRTAATRRGWEQAFRFTSSAGAANTVYLDDWQDLSTLPVTPINDRPNASVSGEIDGATGTLTVPLTWPVEEVPNIPAVRHDYDSDHAQTLAVGSRNRRTFRVQAQASKESERDSLLTFYAAHGAEIPFSWKTPRGDTSYFVFLTDDLEDVLLARRSASDTFSFQFEMQERFA